MRESKYRGKRIDNGEWAYGDLIRHRCGTFICTNTARYSGGAIEVAGIEVYPETVGEFVGLSYTGLDIYEGDVLRLYGGEPYDNGVISFMDYDWEFTGHVIFQNGSFVVSESNDACCIWIDAIFCEDIDVEKLGNIHDNPELLKEGNDE